MFAQLPLSVSLRVDMVFENFYISEANRLCVDALKNFCHCPQESCFYLWGNNGGVTHLLQAVQQQMPDCQIQYLPMGLLLDYDPSEVCSDLELLDIIVIDDIHVVAGINAWEQALFHLYNRLRDAGKKIIVGSHHSSKEPLFNLADLQSRLQWGISFQLYALQENEKKHALQSRATAMGIPLSEEVIQFLFNHYGRDFNQLIKALQLMDTASLSEKRQLTIPFVKQVLQL